MFLFELCRRRKPAPDGGCILFLNGPTSSGKSAVAHSVLQLRPKTVYMAEDQEYTFDLTPCRTMGKQRKALQMCTKAGFLAEHGKSVLIDQVDVFGAHLSAASAQLQHHPTPQVCVLLFASPSLLLQRTKQRNEAHLHGEDRNVWRTLVQWALLFRATPMPTEHSVSFTTRAELEQALVDARALDEYGTAANRDVRRDIVRGFLCDALQLDRWREARGVWLEPRIAHDLIIDTDQQTPEQIAEKLVEAIDQAVQNRSSGHMGSGIAVPLESVTECVCGACNQVLSSAVEADIPEVVCEQCLKSLQKLLHTIDREGELIVPLGPATTLSPMHDTPTSGPDATAGVTYSTRPSTEADTPSDPVPCPSASASASASGSGSGSLHKSLGPDPMPFTDPDSAPAPGPSSSSSPGTWPHINSKPEPSTTSCRALHIAPQNSCKGPICTAASALGPVPAEVCAGASDSCTDEAPGRMWSDRKDLLRHHLDLNSDLHSAPLQVAESPAKALFTGHSEASRLQP